LPFPDPDRLMFLRESMFGRGTISLTWPNFPDWQAQNRAFSGMAAFDLAHLNLTGVARPTLLRAARVTSGLFPLLGIQPELGRIRSASDDRPGAQAPAKLSGLWRTEGYGYLIQVVGDSLKAFEVTDLSCIPAFRAHQIERDESHVVFQREDYPLTFEFIGVKGSADQGRIHYDVTASDMIVQRVDSFPAICDRTTADDPTTTFDVFWETYREHYPFFHLKHVDWQATRDRFRPRVVHASPRELFDVLRSMIEPLHDHHTFIDASKTDTSLSYGGEPPDPDPISEAGRARALEIIKSRFLVVPLRSWCNDQVSF